MDATTEENALNTSIITLSPILVPFAFQTGASESLAAFRQFLDKIRDFDDDLEIAIPSVDARDYENIGTDTRHLHIAVWVDRQSQYPVRFHLFPNAIALVDIELEGSNIQDRAVLEAEVQAQSQQIITESYARFVEFLKILYQQYADSVFINPSSHSFSLTQPHIFWISRAILLSKTDIETPSWQAMITEWLAFTERPEDAQEIIAGRRDYSMTWLNYIVVDCDEKQEDYRIQTMIAAQYIYTAQAQCNNHLKEVISSAYSSTKPTQAAEKLENSRIASRLHQITYHDYLNYMTRPKRQLLDQILLSWEFERLVDNGQRMIEVCGSRIEETNRKKKERSSILTDMLLVSLSFFAVFELSLYLAQFSREAMSKPAFDYNDDKPSFFLSLIAKVDTDIMFGVGFFTTLLLVVVYRIFKSR